MKKKSIVWQFFTKHVDEEGSPRVMCKLCDITPKNHGNTTNLRGHLQRNHPIQWELAVEGVLHDESIRKTLMQERGNYNTTKIKNDDSDTELEDHEITEEVEDVEWLDDTETQQTSDIYVSNLKRKIKHEQSSPARRRARSYNIRDRLQDSRQSNDHSYLAQTQKPIADQYTAFGDYVASKLRNLEPQTLNNVQQIISTILWQAESGYHQNTDMVKKLLISTVLQTEESPTEMIMNPNSHMETNGDTVYVTVAED